MRWSALCRASPVRIIALSLVALPLLYATTTSLIACALTTSFDNLSCAKDHDCVTAPSLDGSLSDAPNNGEPADANVFRSDAAASDDLGNGDGHAGDKTISSAETVNVYAAITTDVTSAATSIDVDNASTIAAGDVVLVWQTTSDQPITSTPSIDLAGSLAGIYELVRVKSVGMIPSAGDSGVGSRIELNTPVKQGYRRGGSQVVRVPEYTSLTIQTAGKLTAFPWDGHRGGIAIALVSGAVQIDGAIDLDGVGLRGGVSFENNGPYNCGPPLDGIPFLGFAAKGEGLVTTQYRGAGDGDPGSAPGGRGNGTNGGGGGHCHNAGAGGGGNGGTGGSGGREYSDTADGGAYGGLGGSALIYSVKERLVPGGGGGAGDRHAAIDTTGGNGGGVLFLRAKSMKLTGALHTNGTTAGETNHDGAGGGGAGGTIAITITGSASCDKIMEANGGSGGSTSMSQVGPGGGGAGGHGYVQSATNANCAVDVISGIAGTQANPNALDGLQYGATPLTPQPGVIEQ